MNGFLLDTNVISELRRRSRMNPQVRAWAEEVPPASLFTSVLVFGELRKGEARLRVRDAAAADALMTWRIVVLRAFDDRILPITSSIADTWGGFDAKQLTSPIDGLIAATAIVHELTLVTRNIADVAHTGVTCFNPFEESPTRPRPGRSPGARVKR